MSKCQKPKRNGLTTAQKILREARRARVSIEEFFRAAAVGNTTVSVEDVTFQTKNFILLVRGDLPSEGYKIAQWVLDFVLMTEQSKESGKLLRNLLAPKQQNSNELPPFAYRGSNELTTVSA